MVNESEQPSQEIRQELTTAIEGGDVVAVERLLLAQPTLANADLRLPEHRNQFTNGYALYRAVLNGQDEIAKLLLEHDAHPDAPGNNPKDQPELGMPLHVAVCEQNFRIANLLMAEGANPNSYPNCDKSTMERLYYLARDSGLVDAAVRRAYSRYLPDREDLEVKSMSDLIGQGASESVMLFARMVDAGGRLPLNVLVRDGWDELALEIVEHNPDEDGSPHDYPRSNVFNNVVGAARWFGYPKLLRQLMGIFPDRFVSAGTIDTIYAAIASHNRDGGFAEYREIIVMQLELLKKRGDLEQIRNEPDFQPLYKIATDFCWPSNYGYKADIVKPECYVDLAELFVEWGFDDINYIDPKTQHSPLTAAVKRGNHPGITTYIHWLLEKGADLRASEPGEMNPKTVAEERGFREVAQLLDAAGKSK